MKTVAVFFVICIALSAQQPKVLLGIDILQKNDFSILNGKKVGLITNQTGVNSNLESTLNIFKKASSFILKAVFSPEHGLNGSLGAGELYSNTHDSSGSIKYYSLYGKTRKPTKEMLAGIDVLVYDIQDIGCRAYTYISTMGLAMETAAENNIEFVVLDRPNPLGGLRIEGNIAEDSFISFVCPFKIPYVYGLTCGELAELLNNEKMLANGIQCNLKVIKMEGWKRKMKFSDTGLIWVPTSPNVPYPQIPFYEIASGILGELSVVGIGITYTLPFQTFAAEWINPDSLADRMNALNLPGVIFRPITYKALYGDWQNKILSGVQIHITDFDLVNLMKIQFYFLQVQRELYPLLNVFTIATTARMQMFDKVLGTDKIRKKFIQRFKVADIENYLDKDINSFREVAKKYYLY